MDSIKEPCICNVKISFKSNVAEYAQELFDRAVKVTNYYIILKKRYTFTVYYKTNVVNITGITSFDKILKAVKKFRSFSNLIKVIEKASIKIDNSTAYGTVLGKINILKLKSSDKIKKRIQYNPLLFPGAFITLKSKKVIIFKSGKYIILGCRNILEINKVFKRLKKIILNHNGGMCASQ